MTKEFRAKLWFPFVTHFGCAYSYKNRQLQLLCVFRKDDEKVPDENSLPCQEEADCKEYEDSVCYNKLCWLLD
ncbi:hypothetical protein Q1695_004215 [Nippostrongylus brasiliensis]|nr:hypothetical protein Q1695_004215 [Nippostrongylus brasiliensis]